MEVNKGKQGINKYANGAEHSKQVTIWQREINLQERC